MEAVASALRRVATPELQPFTDAERATLATAAARTTELLATPYGQAGGAGDEE